MRTHKTYILRLLVEFNTLSTTNICDLRGAIQAITDTRSYPFASGQQLLDPLQCLSNEQTSDGIHKEQNQ